MPDIEAIMKMAQEAQTKILEAQGRLDQIEVSGAAGGGMVTVKATARGRVTGVSIDDSLMAAGDKQMIEDLVAAAFNDARGKAEAAGAAAMQEAAGGLQLPPGFQMPM